MTIIAQTPRIIIRGFNSEEMHHYIDMYTDSRVTQYLPKRSHEDHVKIFQESVAEDKAGKLLGRWGIFNAADHDFIGLCLLRPFEDGSKVELGYSLVYNYWGKGIATEMAGALIDYTFNSTPYQEIVAVTDEKNVASQRVLEKAGMKSNGKYVRNLETLNFFHVQKTII